MRAFFAVDIGDQGTLNAFSALQEEIVRTGMDVKLVDVDKIHLTIKFLGEIEESLTETLHIRMEDLIFPPFEASYVGLGAFPSLNRPSVIWVGLDSTGAGLLTKLSEEVERRTVDLGFKEERSFHSHVTISRVRSGRSKERLWELHNKYKAHAFGGERLTSLKLKKSELTLKGPVYTDVFEIGFK